MHVHFIASSASLGEEISREDQGVCTEQGGVEEELDEELEGGFANDATDPWAEVVHLAHAAVHFAAVVRAVTFPVEAGAAEGGPAIEVADEDVFLPEV